MLRVLPWMVVVMAVACSSGNGTEEQATGGESVTSDGASSAGSCIESYSLETLDNRDFAFDGTVKAVEPGEDADEVTFAVHEWFKGDGADEAVLTAYGFGAITSAGGGKRSVGDRLLVAGDETFLWECGFTQRYDADVAAQWEEALR
ncbi:MAG: hypothetical protein ACREQY_02605 [Candidatus Binatia bacterium]